jgi:hypothetical protein
MSVSFGASWCSSTRSSISLPPVEGRGKPADSTGAGATAPHSGEGSGLREEEDEEMEGG